MRWAKGHNQVAWRHARAVLLARHLSLPERLDGLLLLGVYLLAPMMVLGFGAALSLYMLGETLFPASLSALVAMMTFSAVGNYAAFFEIAAAMHLDDSRRRLRLLPLNFVNFLSSVLNVTRAFLTALLFDRLTGRGLTWEKTSRYRQNGPGAGDASP
jgi:hypothetical protein